MRVKFVPTGCSHIRVESVRDGQVLCVVTEKELLEPILETDTPLIIGMKHLLLNSDTSGGVDLSVLKTAIEGREF